MLLIKKYKNLKINISNINFYNDKKIFEILNSKKITKSYEKKLTNKSYKVLAIAYGHEANACLMIDGEIKSYAAEERFNKKAFVGYPKKAINFC